MRLVEPATGFKAHYKLVIYTNCDGISLSIPQSLKKLLDRLESLKEFYFISGLYIVFVSIFLTLLRWWLLG